jgi:hypothetical protein
MTGRTYVGDLISAKGWIKLDYDKTIWIPPPSGFRPDMTRDEWAYGFGQLWWEASGRKHGKREVKNFAKGLIEAQEIIYSEQPCHLALLHMPDVGYSPLAVCIGIWQALGEPAEQLRELVHAEEPVAIEKPVVEEFWTENLGHGLKSIYQQRLTKGKGVLAVLNYAWRSEQYETALHIYTAGSDWGRLQRAIPDIDEMTRTITIVPSTVQPE